MGNDLPEGVVNAEPSGGWESLYAAAGSAENVRLLGFRNETLQHLTGRTLAEVAMSHMPGVYKLAMGNR